MVQPSNQASQQPVPAEHNQTSTLNEQIPAQRLSQVQSFAQAQTLSPQASVLDESPAAVFDESQAAVFDESQASVAMTNKPKSNASNLDENAAIDASYLKEQLDSQEQSAKDDSLEVASLKEASLERASLDKSSLEDASLNMDALNDDTGESNPANQHFHLPASTDEAVDLHKLSLKDSFSKEQLSIHIVKVGHTKYFINSNYLLDEIPPASLENLFSVDWLKNNTTKISLKGGRGQTILFSLDQEKLNQLGINQRSTFTQAGNVDSYAAMQNGYIDSNAAIQREHTDLNATEQSEHVDHNANVQSENVDNNATIRNEHTAPEAPQTYNWCYRKYLRGGAIGKVIEKKFFRYAKNARRAYDEFLMLTQMRTLGLPVPRPIIAQEKHGPLYFENAIIIEQIPNTRNLAEILALRPLTKLEIESIGYSLSLFFEYNVHHTDLNLRNILLDSKGFCYVIDFDKCKFEQNPYQSLILVNQMLKRLERSFIKAQTLGHIKHFEPSLMTKLRKATIQNLVKINESLG